MIYIYYYAYLYHFDYFFPNEIHWLYFKIKIFNIQCIPFPQPVSEMSRRMICTSLKEIRWTLLMPQNCPGVTRASLTTSCYMGS